jgi:hypothetical protein
MDGIDGMYSEGVWLDGLPLLFFAESAISLPPHFMSDFIQRLSA